MKASDVIKALEDGKRITNTTWPEEHYWELKDGELISIGDGKVGIPKYGVSDLFTYGQWKIAPKHITFSDAMKAIEEGKDVECHYKNDVITLKSYNNKINSICENGFCVAGGGSSLKLAYIVAGKWFVKEDKAVEKP